MSELLDELEGFYRFAGEKLHTPGYESLEELLGLWRANHPVRKVSASAPPPRGKPTTRPKPDPPTKGKVPYL